MLSPRACHICRCRLAVNEEEVCGVCQWHLPLTGYMQHAYDNNLARLFWGRIPIEKAVAYIFYQPHDEASKLIYDLKYHSQPHLGVYLGRQVALDAQQTVIEEPDNDEVATNVSKHHFFDDIDLIIPIPITRRRRRQRGYNQSEMIAKGLHDVTGIPTDRHIVKRKHFIHSQTQLNVSERFDNVENAFHLIHPERVSGRHVLIVDDIITTGATMVSCAKELMTAPDVRISILSIGVTRNGN